MSVGTLTYRFTESAKLFECTANEDELGAWQCQISSISPLTTQKVLQHYRVRQGNANDLRRLAELGDTICRLAIKLLASEKVASVWVLRQNFLTLYFIEGTTKEQARAELATVAGSLLYFNLHKAPALHDAA